MSVNIASDPARELVATRELTAPRELVFNLWSKPEHLTKWWGPEGFRTTTHELEFRDGGTWRFTMHGPDGTDYENVIQYQTVRPHDLIEYHHGGETDIVNFHVIVKFEELGPNTTQLQFRMVFPSADEKQRTISEFGADEGLRGTICRLDVLLLEEQFAANPFELRLALPCSTDILMKRAFRAPKSLVYAAFTKSEMLKQWWGPHDITVPEYSVDLRVGGSWTAVCARNESEQYRFRGEFLEIVPEETLVQTFEFEGFPGHVSKETMSFEEQDGLTVLTMRSSFTSEEERDSQLKSGMIEGATESLEKLAKLLENQN